MDFREYLEAKIDVDDRSLHRGVYRAFLDVLDGSPEPHLLELGAGTGAMLRRIVGDRPHSRLRVLAVDIDAASLETGLQRAAATLRGAGREVRLESGMLVAEDLLEITTRQADVLSDPLPEASFDAVLAHTFMDIVPLGPVLEKVGLALRPGGVFYATATYDGITALLPPADDDPLEAELLEIYDGSMESRMVGGARTGGKRSGTRLVGELDRRGWTILEVGSSDWTIWPRAGRYGAREAVFLAAILDMIEGEGRRAGLDPERLGRWLQSRTGRLARGALGLVTHQLDVLAERPAP